MTLIIFTVLGNYHHYLFPKLFITPKNNSVNIQIFWGGDEKSLFNNDYYLKLLFKNIKIITKNN